MTRSCCLVKYVIFGAFVSAFCLLEEVGNKAVLLRKISQGLEAGGEGGVTLVNFYWVCAAGLPEPLPHFSLFWGQT